MQAQNIFDFKKLVIVFMVTQYSYLYTGSPASAQPQTQTFVPSTSTANMIRTTTDLHHAYHSPGQGVSEKVRQQPWWSQRFRQQQQVQRFHNWKDRREAAAYARNMANPNSADAMKWRAGIKRLQASQAKLSSQEKIKFPSYPVMNKAKTFAEVEAIEAAKYKQTYGKQVSAQQNSAKQASPKQIPAKKVLIKGTAVKLPAK